MDNQQAYNSWSETYDDVVNKTRDVEAAALRSVFGNNSFESILELGCGTGKNSSWLSSKTKHFLGIDFSDEMLQRAKQKVKNENARFGIADITKEWRFAERGFDLISCSLILEHIENIDFIFSQAAVVLNTGGIFYIGELHPFKQYSGSKARFETASGTFELQCFIHNVSDYFNAAVKAGLHCSKIDEWFDDDNNSIPRVLTMTFLKR